MMQEVEVACVVKCDLFTILGRDLHVPYKQRQADVDVVTFSCSMQLSTSCLEVEVVHDRTTLARCEVGVRTDRRRDVPVNDWY